MIILIDKTAVILAGGKSSRMMYQDKSFLKYGENTFIEKIISEVSGYKEILLVANDKSKFEYLGVKVVEDIIPGYGPLSGIHSGLINSGYDYSLIVACDMPFLNREVLDYIGSVEGDYDVLIPKSGDYLQPLCAVYGKNCLPAIERKLQEDVKKIIAFFPEVSVKYIEMDELKEKFTFDVEEMFKNINTLEDYRLHIKET